MSVKMKFLKTHSYTTYKTMPYEMKHVSSKNRFEVGDISRSHNEPLIVKLEDDSVSCECGLPHHNGTNTIKIGKTRGRHKAKKLRDDNDGVTFERGEYVSSTNPEKICVEYKRKIIPRCQWNSANAVPCTDCDCDPFFCECLTNPPVDGKCVKKEKGLGSCYPYRIRKKLHDGQCPTDLYPYEIIRNIPFDEKCKCNEAKNQHSPHRGEPHIFDSELDFKEHHIGKRAERRSVFNKAMPPSMAKTSPNREYRVHATQSDLEAFSKAASPSNLEPKKKKEKRTSILSNSGEFDFEKCQCHPDVNCQCPITGEFKAISRDSGGYIKREPMVIKEYLDNPCMQDLFIPCQGVPIEDEGNETCFPPMPTYGPLPPHRFCPFHSEDGRVPYYGGDNFNNYAKPPPCCPCPKPDPERDNPKYFSTKLNVTDLMKQLLSFHYNRESLNQYYTQLTGDGDEPCETCTSIITQTAGCVGDCCKCPKSRCCNCKPDSRHPSKSSKQSSKQFVQSDLNKSCTCKRDEIDCVKEFENKYGTLFDELNNLLPMPQNKKCPCPIDVQLQQNNQNYCQQYKCYNVSCFNTNLDLDTPPSSPNHPITENTNDPIIKQKNEDINNTLNKLTRETKSDPKEGSFFSRKSKDGATASEQPPRRKREFLSGLRSSKKKNVEIKLESKEN